jgi:addiction module RelE/StbE family toxin
MISLIWSPRFIKKLEKYLKKHPELKDILEEKLNIFVKNPHYPELKNHKLSGNLSGLRAIVITYDCRIVFEPQEEANEVLLVDIGGHDDVY